MRRSRASRGLWPSYRTDFIWEAIGISTSGRSANVVNGLRTARERGARTIGLTGDDDIAAVTTEVGVQHPATAGGPLTRTGL